MKKGILINFEGIDSSGKKTQVNLLKRSLEDKGFKTSLVSFPAYNTPFGKIVGAHLRGEFWTLKKVIPEIAAMLFSINRYEFKNKIERSLKNGKIVLADRYTQSAMAYHAAMLNRKERLNFAEWLKQVESRIPQPNIIFFLDMPVEAAQMLINKRRRKKYLKNMSKDIYEKSITFQHKVRDAYLEIGKHEKNWFIIKCANKIKNKWYIRKPEDIHKEILKIVERFIK